MRATKRRLGLGVKLTKQQTVTAFILTSFVLGIVLGIFSNSFLSDDSFFKLAEDTTSYIESLLNGNAITSFKHSLITNGIIKYGKIMLIFWVLAFLPYGWVAILAVILSRGAVYGFLISFLQRQYYGGMGALYSFLFILPQCIVLLPSYFYIARGSIELSHSNSGKKPPAAIINKRAILLATAFFTSALSGLIDSYITPLLFAILP